MTISVATERKQLGAFYTPPQIANMLARWAVRSPHDRVLDPSFGGLALLEAAATRLCELGAAPQSVFEQLNGCELDGAAFAAAHARTDVLGSEPALLHRDFFAVQPHEDLATVEALVGNPPYIRAHLADGAVGRRIAGAAGVELGGMSSSWAAFTVHAISFVSQGGRMGLVLPGALIHAQYATDVMAFLRRSFRRVVLVLFERRIFPGALEEVVLVLAEGKGEGEAEDIEIVECVDVEALDLDAIRPRHDPSDQAVGDGHEIGDNSRTANVLDQLLPRETRELLQGLAAATEVERLGERATIEIGVVTGANDYFLPSPELAERISAELLSPVISRASQIPGARFTRADLRGLVADGARCRMLTVPQDAPAALLKAIRPYIAEGETVGLHERNKCRKRTPWWSVPLPKAGPPDLFLTYCAGAHPRLVANEANILSTNSVHAVRIRRGTGRRTLATGFINSLSLLSAELEGRSYGGGVLKLEPTEAQAVMLPPLVSGLGKLVGDVDRLIREGDLNAALDLVDPLVLGQGLGLGRAEIAALRAGGQRLRSRRRAREDRPVSVAVKRRAPS
jgi:hypothetical protein